MALNIKDPETERLAAELAAITGESKTRAIRVALQERKQRLAFRVKRRTRKDEMLRFLRREVWPRVPDVERGRRLSRDVVERTTLSKERLAALIGDANVGARGTDEMDNDGRRYVTLGVFA